MNNWEYNNLPEINKIVLVIDRSGSPHWAHYRDDNTWQFTSGVRMSRDSVVCWMELPIPGIKKYNCYFYYNGNRTSAVFEQQWEVEE